MYLMLPVQTITQIMDNTMEDDGTLQAMSALIQLAQHLGMDAQFDLNGQIIIYTGLATDESGAIVHYLDDGEE